MSKFDAHMYGPFFSESGVGESTRAYWRSLVAIGWKIGVIPQNEPFNDVEAQIKADYHNYIVDRAHESLNLFRINAEEIASVPSGLLRSRSSTKNVLIPMWETERLPATWCQNVSLFTAVICATKFIENSIKVSIPNLPTFVALHPIDVVIRNFPTKFQNGMRDDMKLYVYSFAYSSRLARKNPMGFLALHNYRRKELGITDELFLLLASDYPRTETDLKFHKKIIDNGEKSFNYRFSGRPRDVHLSLIASSNAFISTHKSEGIGLQLAEAATLDTPVVSHNYSGPEDFLPLTYKGLVSYKMEKIQKGEYPNAAGQEWATSEVSEISEALDKVLASDTEVSDSLKDISSKFTLRNTMMSLEKTMNNILDL